MNHEIPPSNPLPQPLETAESGNKELLAEAKKDAERVWSVFRDPNMKKTAEQVLSKEQREKIDTLVAQTIAEDRIAAKEHGTQQPYLFFTSTKPHGLSVKEYGGLAEHRSYHVVPPGIDKEVGRARAQEVNQQLISELHEDYADIVGRPLDRPSNCPDVVRLFRLKNTNEVFVQSFVDTTDGSLHDNREAGISYAFVRKSDSALIRALRQDDEVPPLLHRIIQHVAALTNPEAIPYVDAEAGAKAGISITEFLGKGRLRAYRGKYATQPTVDIKNDVDKMMEAGKSYRSVVAADPDKKRWRFV